MEIVTFGIRKRMRRKRNQQIKHKNNKSWIKKTLTFTSNLLHSNEWANKILSTSFFGEKKGENSLQNGSNEKMTFVFYCIPMWHLGECEERAIR